jgi:choline dehydrogenase
VKRRDFFKYTAALGAALRRGPNAARSARPSVQASQDPITFPPLFRQRGSAAPREARELQADYIVVGSGAGGGTVAARLVEEGYSVLVLEAGGNPDTITGGDPLQPDANTYPEDYDVPAFHPLASENDAIKWDFFVRHYEDAAQQQNDPHYVAEYKGKRADGIWYPRAGALGGCTAHNAMILVYPHNSDWNQLADLTGDPSWRAEHMRSYFERLENCQHRPMQRFLARLGVNPTRHGWGGWLHTEKAAPEEAIRDAQVRKALADSFGQALKELGFPSFARLESLGDPNDWRSVESSEVGARYVPLTTRDHRRLGTRERLLEIRRQHPDRLTIETNALASRIILDGTRAIGVEYRKGEHLYAADPRSTGAEGERRNAYAAREVIVSAGAFNTPQLLMLSGIGPPEVLAAHEIDVRVPLPGVGKNLQDRYEIAVVNRTIKTWDMLEGATFSTADGQYQRWRTRKKGIYTTNGVLLSVVARSSPRQPVPDLFCYAVLADFRGYVPEYSRRLRQTPNTLTWVVLKGHTNNTGGTVTLRSKNPCDTPVINFRYFGEGTDGGEEDLDAIVAGVKLVRRLTARLKGTVVDREESPGPGHESPEALQRFIRNRAWGHHASCTCAIGSKARGGVLSSDFKVHDTEGLRVVDASVFPRAPGLFIISAIYMIGEKAADVIIADAKRNQPMRRTVGRTR